ncbi:TIGR01841 family phasin [Cupriavidus sp. 8B]
MNPLTVEQLAAAQKASLEIWLGLASKAAEGFVKLGELNLRVFKATLAETQAQTKKALLANDPQEVLALQANLLPAIAEKVLSYECQTYEIVSATQAELAKVTETLYAEQCRRVEEMVDNLANSAPGGAEAPVAALKSVVSATNALYETLQQAAKQAVDFTDNNFKAASAVASKATKQVVEQASRPAKK